jgi:hypothetical protein
MFSVYNRDGCTTEGKFADNVLRYETMVEDLKLLLSVAGG